MINQIVYQNAPPGWNKVTRHLFFDVNMEFTHKVRRMLDGYKIPDHIGSSYVGVVSREHIGIVFIYAALHDLDVFIADVINVYLQAPSSQNDYKICGPEFRLIT